MLGFEPTATGYRAADEQVAWWQSRDTCPACGTPCAPAETVNGVHYYAHKCSTGDCCLPGRVCPKHDVVYWTRRAARPYVPPTCPHGTEDIDMCAEGGHDQ